MRNRCVLLWVGVGLIGEVGCAVYDESLLDAVSDAAASVREGGHHDALALSDASADDEDAEQPPEIDADPEPVDNWVSPLPDAHRDVRVEPEPRPEPEPGRPEPEPARPEPEPARPEAGALPVEASTRDASCVGTCGPTCNDGILNGSETSIDCGGTCPANGTCALGASCTTGPMCQSGYCKNQVCSRDFALRYIGAEAFSFARPVADDFTIELWVKTTQLAAGNLWYNGAWLFQADMTVNANDFGTSLLSGKFAFGTGNPDFNVVSTSLINTGQWTHVAATRVKATGMLSVFVNGVMERAAASTNTSSLNATTNAYVGCTVVPCSHAYVGELDEVRVWKVARSAAQIAATMKTRLSGSEANLVGYWRLDEGQGKTFQDSSPSKINGAWTTSDDPVFTVSGVPMTPSP